MFLTHFVIGQHCGESFSTFGHTKSWNTAQIRHLIASKLHGSSDSQGLPIKKQAMVSQCQLAQKRVDIIQGMSEVK